MSRLKEVLHFLGLEVNEEYYLFRGEKRFEDKYIIDKDGLVWRKDIEKDTQGNFKKETWLISNIVLLDLINGTIKAEPVSFTPKFGDKYWSYSNDRNVRDTVFVGDAYDLFRLGTGFCFKTEQMAIINKPKYEEMLKQIGSGKKLKIVESEKL